MLLNRSLYIWVASVVCIVGILYVIAYLLHQPINSIATDSKSLVPVTLASVGDSSSGIPVLINIPSIHLDTDIEDVGLTSSGEIDVPKDPMNTAWYNLSPSPGEIGNSIIDGHYGWKDGLPSAFDHLSDLRKGDMIYIKNDIGSTTTFIVTKSVIYNENNNSPDIFVSTDGKAHLNLITCGGVWDKVRKSYSNRLVVFTDLKL